jgi:hypothetical protein
MQERVGFFKFDGLAEAGSANPPAKREPSPTLRVAAG